MASVDLWEFFALSSPFLQHSHRYHYHSIFMLLGIMVVHIACFATSVSLLNKQQAFMDEVDVAGEAVIAMHRTLIDA